MSRFESDLSQQNHHQQNEDLMSKKQTDIPDYIRVICVTDVNGRKKNLYIPASLDLDRPKRPRTIFSARQIQILEREFEENHFCSEIKRAALSNLLNLSEVQIKVWFQNKRTKMKKRGVKVEKIESKLSSNSHIFVQQTPRGTPIAHYPLFCTFNTPNLSRSTTTTNTTTHTTTALTTYINSQVYGKSQDKEKINEKYSILQ